MYLIVQHPSVIHKAWLAVDPQRAFSGDTYRDVRGTPPLWAVRALSAIFLTVRSLRCPRRGQLKNDILIVARYPTYENVDSGSRVQAHCRAWSHGPYKLNDC